MSLNSRRHALGEPLVAAADLGSSSPEWAATPKGNEPPIEDKEGMITHSLHPLNIEMPPEFADSWLTPVPHFFVRNHLFEPSAVNTPGWKLTVGGEVESPLTFSLAELEKLEQHSITNTLECAGNGRAFHYPRVPETQWRHGAVGNALFSGPRLVDIMQRAGLRLTGKHVVFRGLDDEPGDIPPFIRSIPIEKAIHPDTLIATHMNGSPLTQHHGAPARALVPGWVGAASCKWLAEINVVENEFDGYFMKPVYRYPNRPVAPGTTIDPADTRALTGLTVKSLIAGPRHGSKLKLGVVHVHGVAWAGEADITKVEVSTDNGRTWHLAALGKETARYAWRLWSYWWRPKKSEEYLILSRATDSQGRVQPETAVWNPNGYLYNAIDRVKVSVEA